MKFIPEILRSPDGESASGAEVAVEAAPVVEGAAPEGEPNGEAQGNAAIGANAAVPVAPTPPPSAQTGLVARIGQLTRQKRELEERVAAYEQGQQQQVGDGVPLDPTQMDPETARRTIDLEISRRAQMLAQQEAWKSTADRVWNEGVQKFPDWATQINTMAALLGEIPRSLTEAAIETGAPTEVLYHLAQNAEQATQIALMPAAKQGVALAKIASEISGGGGRKGTNAPPPVTPRVAGGGVSAPPPSLDDPNISMEKWAELRNAEVRAKKRR
jgi:hypothetical protein